MKADEIVDQEKLRVWLNARPDDQRRKEAVTLAQRCACRVFPIFGQAMNTDLARNRKLTALPVLRVNLTSGVYAKAPRPEIDASATLFSIHAAATTADNTRSSASIDAGRAAVNAAGVANGAIATADPVFRANLSTISTNSAIHAATDAASAARSVFTSGHYDIWEQIRADAHIIEAGGDPLDIRLWSISEPDWFKQVDTEMRTIWWESNPADWDFWTRWWDGVLSGQQLDWGLQEAVALIDNEVWKAGPGAVAGAIREIEAWFSKNANVLRAEALLHAALADYSFDAIDRVMRMVPFEEDIRHLRDPARLSAFLDDADSIRDDLEMFSRALAAEGAMQHAGFVRTYLDGVLDELSRAR